MTRKRTILSHKAPKIAYHSELHCYQRAHASPSSSFHSLLRAKRRRFRTRALKTSISEVSVNNDDHLSSIVCESLSFAPQSDARTLVPLVGVVVLSWRAHAGHAP